MCVGTGLGVCGDRVRVCVGTGLGVCGDRVRVCLGTELRCVCFVT